MTQPEGISGLFHGVRLLATRTGFILKEETAGRKRRGLAGRELWGFWGRGGIAHVAAGLESGRCYREERTRRAFSGARMRAAGVDGRLERVCGGREDIAFVLRRVVGDEDDRRCAAGSAAIVMRCRS